MPSSGDSQHGCLAFPARFKAVFKAEVFAYDLLGFSEVSNAICVVRQQEFVLPFLLFS